MSTRIKKASELSLSVRAITPVATVIGGVGGYALQSWDGGSSTVGSLISGGVTALWAGGLAFVATRCEEVDDSSTSMPSSG